MSSIITAPATTQHSDDIYQGLETLVANNIGAININEVDLFKVDIKEGTGKSLFSHYLEHYSEADRPHYNCRVCAEWLKRYGQLVTIKDGVVNSVAFGTIPDNTDPAVAEIASHLASLVATQPVISIFTPVSNKAVVQNDGTWSHFQGTFASNFRSYLSFDEASSVTGVINEEVRNTKSWLFKYVDGTAVTTVTDLLTSGELSYAIKQREEFKSLAKLITELKASKNNLVKNALIWEHILKNRTFFGHFQSSSLGELLSKVHEGELELGVKRFKEFTASINYKRPTELPSERELEEARKFVADNGLAPSLKRRYASLEDCKRWLWKSPVVADKVVDQNDPFANVAVKDAKEVAVNRIDGGNISFLRFVDEILPKAKVVKMVRPGRYYGARENFLQFVTASDPEAKPIIKWDSVENRNPVSSFCYNGGSTESGWFNDPKETRVVKGFSFLPDDFTSDKTPMRYGLPENGVLFVLEGCEERNNPGLALFPEVLSADLRPARRVIEEYSNKGKLDPRLEGTEPLAGVHFGNGSQPVEAHTFEVTLESGTVATYRITSYY